MCLITCILPVTQAEANSYFMHISSKLKEQTSRKRFALLKNDITNILGRRYFGFHSRDQRFRIDGSYRNRNHIRGVWIQGLKTQKS